MKSSIRLFVAVLFFAVVTSLSSSAQAHFSTAGGGGFWGPGLTENASEWQSQAFDTTIAVNTGEVRVRQFILQSSFTIGHITTVLKDGPYSGTFDFGIYDASGNLLLDAGVFNGAYAQIGTVQTNSITSVTLCPGTYYFAQTTSSSVVQVIGVGGGGSTTDVDAIANATTPRFAIAANVASGSGALPSTLGTLTAEGTNTTGTATPFFEP